MKDRKLQIQIFCRESNKEMTESFREISNFVGNLYNYYLPPVKAVKARKIVVEFLKQDDEFNIIPENLNYEIVTIEKSFDFKKFNNLTLRGKEEFVLMSLYKSLRIVFKKMEIDPSFLKIAYDQVFVNDFKLIADVCGGPQLNKNKNLFSNVIAEYFVGYSLISVIFSDIFNNVINKIYLFKTWPDEWSYLQLIKKSKWIDNEVILLSNKNNEINFKVHIDGEVSTFYSPIGRDIEGIKEEIKVITQELYIEI